MVKMASPDVAPGPQLFSARTLTKYIPAARLVNCVLVPVTVRTAMLLAPAAVPTSTRYCVAPLTAPHDTVPVVPDPLADGVPGAPGGTQTMVSRWVVEAGPAPQAFCARTRT
jgi:hypothetical protein